MKKLKIGIIGYGKMGKIRHNAVEKSRNTEVIVIFDPKQVTVNDKIQVVCAFYHKRIITKLESEIENGNYSLFKLVEKLNSYYINFGNNESFLNMNTKKDLRAVEKILISKTSL